jgi:hypothetical protein
MEQPHPTVMGDVAVIAAKHRLLRIDAAFG